MSDQSPKESVRQILGALHEERLRSMDPAALKINIDQRRTLVETADPAGYIKAGDGVEPFSLPEVDGGRIEPVRGQQLQQFVRPTHPHLQLDAGIEFSEVRQHPTQ